MFPVKNNLFSEEVENDAVIGNGEFEVAIVLAGGLGTRLSTAVPGLPKCMAPVAGKPFIHYVITYFQHQGIRKFIFSLGYLHEIIEKYLVEEFSMLDYHLSIEREPLGTGGAIKLACEQTGEQSVAVINGDTFFKINLRQLSSFHKEQHAECTLCLKPMENFDRYGVVELRENLSVKNFHEKKFYSSGLINGGVYGLNVKNFLDRDLPEKFSFEKDYLEKFDKPGRLMGFVQNGYFIDIGVPQDYKRAQSEIKKEQ